MPAIESEIRQKPGLLLHRRGSVSNLEIFKRLVRELAAVLNIMPEQEDRNDERGRNKSGPQSARRVPNLCAGAHKYDVDEREDRSEPDDPGRRAVGPRNVAGSIRWIQPELRLRKLNMI